MSSTLTSLTSPVIGPIPSPGCGLQYRPSLIRSTAIGQHHPPCSTSCPEIDSLYFQMVNSFQLSWDEDVHRVHKLLAALPQVHLRSGRLELDSLGRELYDASDWILERAAANPALQLPLSLTHASELHLVSNALSNDLWMHFLSNIRGNSSIRSLSLCSCTCWSRGNLEVRSHDWGLQVSALRHVILDTFDLIDTDPPHDSFPCALLRWIGPSVEHLALKRLSDRGYCRELERGLPLASELPSLLTWEGAVLLSLVRLDLIDVDPTVPFQYWAKAPALSIISFDSASLCNDFRIRGVTGALHFFAHPGAFPCPHNGRDPFAHFYQGADEACAYEAILGRSCQSRNGAVLA